MYQETIKLDLSQVNRIRSTTKSANLSNDDQKNILLALVESFKDDIDDMWTLHRGKIGKKIFINLHYDFSIIDEDTQCEVRHFD